MDNTINYGKSMLAALAFLVLIPVSAVYADDESDSASGHWFMGGSWGNLQPDADRQAGTTRIFGAHGGYQFNDNWSFQLGYASSAGRHDDDYNIGTPWGARVRMYETGFTRYWGDKYRFLVDFGYTHISMDVNTARDDATAGWHVGAGVSTFITDNIEVRAVAREVYSANEHYEDLIGTVSLNWHFVDGSVASADNTSVLGESKEESQSLPPVTYREEPVDATPVEVAPEAVAPVSPSEAAPVVAEPPVADVVPVPAETAVAPAVIAAEPAAVAPAASTEFVSPAAVPTSTHTLLNFDSNSLDINKKYGAQLDQLSQEIGDSKAVIEGHTDSRGSSESNKVLSLDRAIVVKRELKNRGVSSDKIKAVGMGEEHPVATNDTPEGRAQNRRVEVKIYDNK